MEIAGWWSIVYFVVFIVLVNFVVLNLVIAVVLEGLELRDETKG